MNREDWAEQERQRENERWDNIESYLSSLVSAFERVANALELSIPPEVQARVQARAEQAAIRREMEKDNKELAAKMMLDKDVPF